LASINVTPLVDVMLVLLIVFMVTATLDRQGIPVSLPSASAAPLASEPQALTVTLDRDNHLFLNEAAVGPGRLTAELQARGGPRVTLVFRADREVPYGRFVEVVAQIRAAGIERLAIEAEVPLPGQP